MATVKVTRRPRDVVYAIQVSTEPGRVFGPFHFGDAVREVHSRTTLSLPGAQRLVMDAAGSRDWVSREFG